MRAFGPAVRDSLERVQRRRDFAGRGNAKSEMTVGEIGERAGERFAAAVDEVERGLETRRHPPLHVGRGIGEGGLRQPDAGRRDSEPGDELPPSRRHFPILPIAKPRLGALRRFNRRKTLGYNTVACEITAPTRFPRGFHTGF